MDNPEKLTTFGTQDTGQINVREGHSKMNNREKQSTFGTQDTGQINVRESQSKMNNREKQSTFGKQDEQSKKTQHNMCSTRICANKHK
jgi:triacylglycerol esterase/lipase EstA (alpha/beta hydrolase family)